MKTKGYLFKMLPCRSKPRIPWNSLSKAHPYVSSHKQQLPLQCNNHRSQFTFQDCCRVAVYESSSEGASHSSLTNLRPGHDSGATTTAPTWCHHLPLGKVNCNWGGFRQTFYSSLLFDHFSLCYHTPPPPPSNVRFWLLTFFSRTQYGLGTVF